MKQRILTIMLALVAIALNASAESYNIWLAGTQLSNANLSGDPTTGTVDVTGISGVTGSVKLRVNLPVNSWDQVIYQLYLDNATIINTSNSSSAHQEGIYCSERLQISLTGTNTVRSTYGTGIDFHNNWQSTIYNSNGTLTVKGTSGIFVGDSQDDFFIDDEPDSRYSVLTINCAEVTIEGTNGYGICGSILQEKYLNSLQLSNLSVKGTEGAICNFNELSFGSGYGSGQSIQQPSGARVVNHAVCDASGNIIMGQNWVIIANGALETYAWLDGSTLRFYYDTQRSARDGITYDIPWEGQYPGWTGEYGNSEIKMARFESFHLEEPLDASYMFYRMSNLTEVQGLFCLWNNPIANTSYMFAGCSSLQNLNYAKYINTVNVTDMSYMFANCSSLQSLDLNVQNTETDFSNSFNTSNVTNMEGMFEGCSNLTTINLTKFNTVNVTSMKNMFKDCGGLTSLSIASFNTSSVTDMTGMFSSCTSIQTIFAADTWSTASVVSSDNMFYDCISLRGGIGTSYKASNPKDKTYARIDGASSPGYFSGALRINETSFPDANFREWVLQQEYGKDAELQPSEILSVKTIDVHNKGINNLKGIEYFTSLTTLNCASNRLESLDISKNAMLTTLQCQNNLLISLDVTNNTELTSLYCFSNQINVTEMGELVESLPTVTSGQGTFIVQYYSDHNEGNSMTLAQRDAAVAKNWDVRSFTGDFELRLRIDEGSFPDGNFRAWLFQTDYGMDGILTDSEIRQMTSINVSNKQIADLKGIENFTALETLDCSHNQLSCLDVSDNTMLTTLDCSQNQLKHLDVTNNTRLRTIYCYSNMMKPIQMKAFFELYLPTITSGTGILRAIDYDNKNEGNDLTNVSFKLASDKGWVVENRFDGNWVVQTSMMNDGLMITKARFPDDNFRNWLLQQSFGRDSILTEDEISEVNQIDVTGKNIADLKGIEVFTALSSLKCSRNNLSNESVEYLINALPYCTVGGSLVFGISMEALAASELLLSNIPGLLEYYYNNDREALKMAVFDDFLNTMCHKLDIVDNRYQDEGNVVTYAAQQSALDRGWVMREYKENTAKWKLIDCCVEINEENFPDQNFRNWLFRQSYGADGKLYNSEINRVTTIDLHSENIQNLKGIEHFTELENLYCYRNQIEGDNMLDLMFILTTDTRMQIIRDIIMNIGSAATGDFDRKLYVLSADNDDEKNVCDKACVRIANERGWKVFCLNNNAWAEYAGSENAGSGLKGDMNNDNKITITDAVIIVDTILEKE